MHIIFIFIFFLIQTTQTVAASLTNHSLYLPPGFKIEIYASVPNARSLALGTHGTVFVGTLSAGKVYAISANKGVKRVMTIASGLKMPNGIAFHNGALFVAEMGRILRFDHIEEHLTAPLKPTVIRDDLPREEHHGWRYLRIGSDDKIYVSIGMPCNVCLPDDPRFGTISRMNLDGSHFTIHTRGIRNSVGFAWDEKSHKLWFTDNGRDWMGDDLPPDKLNYVKEEGLDFGFPYYDAKNLPNSAYKRPSHAIPITFPTLELPAHVAPLGMAFYQGKMFPDDYHGRIFIAEHGSWNRSKKTGYQVITVKIVNDQVVDVKPFLTGFLQGQHVKGRPVDILEMKDGSLLVSDDFAGVIYRISYDSSH